ncbi:hypothetical protein BD408DRAFT_424849 [Parasitella parasitica]|nr:hypothetical protein BD408DRAFT_424849 [Parasitella parasitica]
MNNWRPFTQPMNWKLDADLVNQLLLNNKKIVNLIVQSLLGVLCLVFSRFIYSVFFLTE